MDPSFFAIPLGASAGCLAAMLPRRVVPVILLLSIACSGGSICQTACWFPCPAAAIHDQWDGGACLQSTPSTCGPASIATILRSLGFPASEREVARNAFTYAGGTEAWYLARYVRSQGLNVTLRLSHRHCREDLKLPALDRSPTGRIRPLHSCSCPAKGDFITHCGPAARHGNHLPR